MEHEFYFPLHIWDNPNPFDELIFFKMVNTTNQHLSSALWQCLWHDQPVESDCALSSVLCVFPGCRKKWKIDKVGTPQDRLWKLKDKDEKKHYSSGILHGFN